MAWTVKEKTTTTLDITFITLVQARFALTGNGSSVSTDLDNRLTKLITAARKSVEMRMNRFILTSTWTWRSDTFPSGNIEIPLVPIQSISSVKYYNTDTPAVLTTLTEGTASGNYEVDIYTGRIRPIDSWPATKASRMASVEVEFIVGDAIADVPEDIRDAVIHEMWERYHGDNMTEMIESKIKNYRKDAFA